ncbi:MAG TPA: alanine racemase [Thermomicrobiales bacterium]|nr:alanine racemase [Thermomicrobiales bacterium]
MNVSFEDRIDRIRSGTHAVIDLDAYASNIDVLRSIVGDDVALMAVVKADGYGHGAIECGRAAIDAGALMLGVARVQEALYLRRAGLDCQIVLIGPPAIGDIPDALRHDITLSIGSQMAVDGVVAAVEAGLSARVHVKVDTGMNRYGFTPDNVCNAVEALASHPRVTVEGVFTHFSSADELDHAPTDVQVERFQSAVDQLEARGLRPQYVHTSNSAAILTGRSSGTNLVRSGIATYGLSPSDEVDVDSRFKPVLSIHSVVARRGTLHPGEGVSYGRTYIANGDEPIASVPVGYADGLPRRLRNQGWFVIEGERAPIRGSVCMDQTVASVVGSVAEGSEVLVLGSGASGEMTFDLIAAMIGTVNYEVATRMMARVPRVYMRSGNPIAWELILTGERGSRGW